MPDASTDNVMMIGPSQAGKTTLLSVLRLASARALKNGGEVLIHPVNDLAKQLFYRALDIVKTGSIVPGSTQGAMQYTFELTCDVEKQVLVEEYEDVPGPWPWSKPNRVVTRTVQMSREPKKFTLNVLDGKGGDVFEGRDELEDEDTYLRRRAELVRLAAESSALVVCVNASDPESTKKFFGGLQRFLDEVHVSGVRTPFARVVIALTQADRKVEQYGSSAEMRLEEMDPAAVATKTLGFYAMSDLFRALGAEAQDRVYAGWVSVYGFIPEEGSVNFDSANNRIAIFRPSDAAWTDEWVPYRVVEPFLFACTGEVCDLSRISLPRRNQDPRSTRSADPKPDSYQGPEDL